jgi:hypothetical protein
MHQPMHAAMIMLVDLYERPTSVEAPRSRAFIDQIFAMSGPDGGIVSGEDGVTVQRPLREGGREAWDLLRKLREKAWRKAGLDPDVLWTEASQIDAGVAQPLTEMQKMAQSLREDVLKVDPQALPRNGETRPSASAGVKNLMTSAVNDFRNSTDSPTQSQPSVPVVPNANEDQHRSMTAFPPAASFPPRFVPSQSTVPGPAPGVTQPNGSYSAAAPSVSTSPFDPNLTLTTTTSDKSQTIESSGLDIHGAGPASGVVPAAPHEENHDADFWTKWDSILGSHTGFTFEDMMEDIQWDDLGGHG